MLTNPEKLISIYWYFALIGTIVFVLKTLIPIDTGTEVTGDFNVSVDTDASFNLFTIEGISAFFMSAGWIGWFALKELEYSVQYSITISVIAGLLGMFLFAFLISQFKKLEHVPKADIKELEGKKGKAYLRFEANGSGKIQIEFMSKLQILDAINSTEDVIDSFCEIEVTKTENGTIYIKRAE